MRKKHRTLLLALLVVGGAAAALLVVPVQVSGPSMLPALHEGQRVLTVPLWVCEPERHELVVFEEPDSGQTAIKRVAGLPGERVQLLDGDLFVNGARHQREVESADDLIPLIDAEGASVGEQFGFDEGGNDFVPDGSDWVLQHGLAFLRRTPLDGFLGADGPQGGERPASDLGVEAEFALEGESARFQLTIVEGPVRFHLEVDRQRNRNRFLLRRTDQSVAEELAEAQHAGGLAQGELFFAKVDQRLVAVWNGEELFPPVAFDSGEAIPLVGAPPGPPVEQIGIGGEGPVRIGRIRVGRDLYRDSSGTFGCGSEFQLAEDEFYLLGDNSAASRDSRHYGPVSRDRLRAAVLGHGRLAAGAARP